MTLTFVSLFSGIDGLGLGLERAGMRCVAQVEQDSFCLAVLRRQFPTVPKFEDVHDVGAHNLPPADLIAGGFPCQDISYAGYGAGIDEGDRSGLWREFHRILRELRPRYALVENVAALTRRGLGRVLGDLADIGFDAEWSVLSACSVGAPHVRRRLFVVAYPHSEHGRPRVWDTASYGDRALQGIDRLARARARWAARLADPSALYRDADGLPFGMDRNRGVGNAVVPDVAEVIGRQILAREAAEQAA